MYQFATAVFALSTLLSTTSAFAPVEQHPSIRPTRSISTIPNFLGELTPTITAIPDSLPILSDSYDVELRKRQVTGQVPAGAATAITQVPPITSYVVHFVTGGQYIAKTVGYTQLFSPVPDQWPSPSAGTIGLGTIQGAVGVVKTKRSEPTQEPVAILVEPDQEDQIQKIGVKAETSFSIASRMAPASALVALVVAVLIVM